MLPFTPDLKLISFTNPFLHSHSYTFRTAFTDLNLYHSSRIRFLRFSKSKKRDFLRAKNVKTYKA